MENTQAVNHTITKATIEATKTAVHTIQKQHVPLKDMEHPYQKAQAP